MYLDEQQTEVKIAPSHQSALYEVKFGKDKPGYFIINADDGKLKWEGKAVSGHQTIGNGTNIYIYLETENQLTGIFALK